MQDVKECIKFNFANNKDAFIFFTSCGPLENYYNKLLKYFDFKISLKRLFNTVYNDVQIENLWN